MTTHPAVSIILPTYNRVDTLERAVRSVKAQTFGDWELIVVDDGSQDGSDALIEKIARDDPRIRLLRQANAGVAAARNTGLSAARGGWITFLDSDDAWLPHFLDLTTSFLRSEPDQHFVTTEFVQDYGNGFTITHNRDDVSHYLRLSRTIGSASHDLPLATAKAASWAIQDLRDFDSAPNSITPPRLMKASMTYGGRRALMASSS